MNLTIEINESHPTHNTIGRRTKHYDYVVKRDNAIVTYGRVEHVDQRIAWEELVDKVLQRERCEGND